MTEISRPWQSTSPGDAGPYSAAQWQQLYQSIIGLGAPRANVGVLLGTGTQPTHPLRVQAQGTPSTSIDVLAGSAIVQGAVYMNSATVSFVIAANSSGNPRIDTVVLRSDYALQTIRLTVLQGTPAASPSAPSLTQTPNVMWDIPLADIAVANGFATITNANITSRAEPANAADGVYLDSVLNNSGGTLNDGDVVIWDTTADRAVKLTTTLDDKLLAGVWRGQTANGAYGRVQTFGIGYVNGAAAITRGNILVSSATTRKTSALTTGSIGAVLGIALETTSGAGLVLTHINVHKTHYLSYARYLDSKSNGTAAASLTSGAWRTRELTTEDTDPDGLGTLAGNQITLQAGVYLVWASANHVNATNNGRLRLRDVTNGVTLAQGNNNSTGNASAVTMVLFGAFILTGQAAVELQHYPTQTAAGGVATSTGEAEIYAEVLLMRIGET